MTTEVEIVARAIESVRGHIEASVFMKGQYDYSIWIEEAGQLPKRLHFFPAIKSDDGKPPKDRHDEYYNQLRLEAATAAIAAIRLHDSQRDGDGG